MPLPLYPQGILDGHGKSCPHWGSIPWPSRLQWGCI